MTAAPEQEVRELPPVRAAAVTDLREHPNNPRKIGERAVQQVAYSLRRFGWKQPLVVDGDGYLAVGHTRLRAAKLLGLTHVPVVDATDLTADEVKAYRIADNRTHDFTTWDLPELSQQLEELEADFAEVLALAIRNPLVVRDHALYQQVADRLSELAVLWLEAERRAVREKVQRRKVQADRMREERLRGARSPSRTASPAPAVQLPTEAEVAAASDGGHLTPAELPE